MTIMGIVFYPTISYGEFGKYAHAVPRALLPVSSWAGAALRRTGCVATIPVPQIPPTMTDVAADCGGFVASFKWGGTYKYSPAQYVDWLGAWATSPSWAAVMDYCCENEITSGKAGIVCERQEKTTAMTYHFWQSYRDIPWVWVPTIQGWEVTDYVRHAKEMKPIISEMHAHYSNDIFRVGIGTLCHRASSAMIQDVVLAVAAILPDVPLHLWGVKLGLAQSTIAVPEQVVSVDSGAWNGMFGHGRQEWKLSPYSQREWCFKVALPRYEAKVLSAL